MKIRTYSELCKFDNFLDRYRYLALRSTVGVATFGFDRWMNQLFYTSSQWRHIRHHVIARDLACDLGVEDHDIYERLYIHHMNPIVFEDIVEGDPDILDPEFLITTTLRTHNAIHYGDESQLTQAFVERRPGDTLLWGNPEGGRSARERRA